MKSLSTWWVVYLMAFLGITACSSSQKEMEKVLAGERYGGIIPCADCEGIAYSLSFFANSRYQSQSMYIGKSNEKFMEEGYWRAIQDSVIELQANDGDTRRINVMVDHLLMLDKEGREIEGKLSSRYKLRNTRQRPLMGSVEGKPGSAVDFKAHGNEPFWGLEIDLDSLISFRMINGDSVGISMAEVKADTAGGVYAFSSKTGVDSMNVELHPIGCMDNMSGQVYDYRVKITSGENKFSGCGAFVQ